MAFFLFAFALTVGMLKRCKQYQNLSHIASIKCFDYFFGHFSYHLDQQITYSPLAACTTAHSTTQRAHTYSLLFVYIFTLWNCQNNETSSTLFFSLRVLLHLHLDHSLYTYVTLNGILRTIIVLSL